MTETILYRGAFPAGFKPLVERLLKRDYADVTSESEDESGILFRGPRGLFSVPYLQSLSIAIDSMDERSLEGAYRSFASRLGREGQRFALKAAAASALRGRSSLTFAIRALNQGEPTSVGKAERAILEGAVQGALSSGSGGQRFSARPESARPDLELQVSLRAGDRAYFLSSLKTSATGQGEKGELPRTTSRLLCELSEPSPSDVFLDPFMGSGALPLERARMMGFKMIFAGDRGSELVDSFKEKLKEKGFEKRRKVIFPKEIDARDLGRFEDGLFTAIVTDPPWGVFEGKRGTELQDSNQTSLFELYSGFLEEAHRVLADDGKLVLLVGRDGPLDEAMARMEGLWRVEEEFKVLVSGRKARALKIIKNNGHPSET